MGKLTALQAAEKMDELKDEAYRGFSVEVVYTGGGNEWELRLNDEWGNAQFVEAGFSEYADAIRKAVEVLAAWDL